jgi:hypothetical protein
LRKKKRIVEFSYETLARELIQQATTANIADCTNPLAREGSELGLEKAHSKRICADPLMAQMGGDLV